MSKMQTAKYVKCEITGEFIPEDECEVVTLKIVKKKGIKFRLVEVGKKIEEETEEIETEPEIKATRKSIEKKEAVPITDMTKLPDDIVGKVNPDAPARKIRPPKLPAAFKGVFIENDRPGAAVDTRRV
jgi:hypothetical protein